MRLPRQGPRPPRRADRFAVVMAGGTGTRFWPRSRRRLPKQLLRITGSRTLLQAAVDRLMPIVPASHILVVTHRDHAAEVARQLDGLPRRNVLAEPVGRNTAPCLALAAMEIGSRHPGATFVTVPADHAVDDARAFRDAVLEAFAWASSAGRIVLIGLRPRRAETGYGYIEGGSPVGGHTQRVRSFVEKPAAARARRFLASGRYLWNSGMFVWRADTVHVLLARHLPALLNALRRAADAPVRARRGALVRAYRRLDPVSIDQGLIEKEAARAPRGTTRRRHVPQRAWKDAGRATANGTPSEILVVRGDFGWSDVGSWAALAEITPGATDGARVVAVDAARNIVFSPERMVALVGVDDVIVVDAADALLICRRDRAQDVRRVVQELERRRLDDYL